jgi:surfactin synthase thioesterase subunit
VCPVQLPGREGRLSELALKRMGDLVPAAARALLPYLGQPFAFFGHSMGALVAFELARHVRAEHGLLPQHLFVSGHGAPHARERATAMHALSDREFTEKLREMQGTPEEVLQHEELRQLIMPVLRADFELCETYRYEPGQPLACPISALGGLQDPYVAREALEQWRRHTLARFEARTFPGDHFFLNSCRPLVIYWVVRAMMDAQTSSLPAAIQASNAAAWASWWPGRVKVR